MKKLLFTLFIGFILVNCNNSKNNRTTILQLIPENTSVVLKINDVETFKSDLINNTLSKNISKTSFYKSLNNALDGLQQLEPENETLICFNKNEDSVYTIITRNHDSLLPNKSLDTLKYFTKTVDSLFVLSSSKNILNSIKVNLHNKFNNLNKTSNTKSFSIFLNNESSNSLGALFNTSDKLSFSDWTVLDTEMSPDQIAISGLTINTDTPSSFIDLFKNTIPQENTINKIAPSSSKGFTSFTYDDFQTIKNNLEIFREQAPDSLTNHDLLETITEIGEIYESNDTILALRSIDIFSTQDVLKSNEHRIGNYRNFDIYEFNNGPYFTNTLSPLVTANNINVYTIIDSYIVLAPNETNLHQIIANYQNGTTAAANNNFKQSVNWLSDEASFLFVSNTNTLKSSLEKLFNEPLANVQLRKYDFSGFQLIQDDGFVHINGIIKKNKSRAQQNTITEEFSVTLDADILNDPQFVINHRTKQKDIVIQDINNSLYLISNRGKVLWKKQLQGPVLGKIEQVDLYKNGRLQLAFATPKRIYIVDRNGNDVSPFPLKFNNNITQPLSIFDYDNRKNYRFLVTQNNVLIMYDKNGKRVNGFKFNNTSDAIITSPKHFRINNKDHIVFIAGNKMNILNRRGAVRINVNESIEYSGNNIYRHNNLFTTSSAKGELIQVNMKGQISKQSLNLNDKHSITATSKTLATLSENKLSIKQRTQELDFGNYTAPQIFYLNDKIYIALTDLQTQKVYLFDSQSKSINNFPIYGNSGIDLANMDKDSNLEIVTKGESNSIIVYQKN